MRYLMTAFICLLTSMPAFAHHGWNEYDADKPMELTGTIQESGYTHPHGYVVLKAKDKSYHVVLAPPTRMENRGLSREMLTSGNQATVYAYPNRSKPDELRAERITVNQKTTELR
jgi:hypothetical protein